MSPLKLHILNGGGEARPEIVLLHGFMGAGMRWRTVARELAPDWSCLCPDLPCHGDDQWSPEIDAPADMAGTAARVWRTLDEHGVKPRPLLGYSMGARLALYMAVTHPERVSHLVLESGSPGLETSEEQTSRALADERLAVRLAGMSQAKDAFQVFLQEWCAQPIFAPEHASPELVERRVAERANNNPTALAASLRALSPGNQPGLWDALSSLNMPVLVLAGQQDRKYCVIARAMTERLPNATLYLFDGCAHDIHAQCPERYARVVRNFLNHVSLP